jgi:DNA-3-methyladenine glycosylase II
MELTLETVVAETLSLAGTIGEAERHLAKSCAVMARLTAAYGHCQLADTDQDPFRTLASSIIGQQLSARAACTIRARVEAIVPGFDATTLLATTPDALRPSGLSGAKIRSLRDLAQRVTNGRLNLSALTNASDKEVIAELTAVIGIGRWTAEMFLIFGLQRLNVLALSDAGLRRAVRLLYGDDATLEAVGLLWQPYCSVASWYLWHHLDAAPQDLRAPTDKTPRLVAV